VNDRIYFNEVLTPNILAYKNGLKYQVKELKDLMTLLQTAGTFASILGMYSGVLSGLKASMEGVRRNSPIRSSSRSGSRSGGSKPPGGTRPPGSGAVP